MSFAPAGWTRSPTLPHVLAPPSTGPRVASTSLIGSPLTVEAVARQEIERAREEMKKLFHTVPCKELPTFYLYQPIRHPGLSETSPGSLYDIGPAPEVMGSAYRGVCAAAGRTGEFLAYTPDAILSRVPAAAPMDEAAEGSFRGAYREVALCNELIEAETVRHDLGSDAGAAPPTLRARKKNGKRSDEATPFPTGGVIHHVAIAPLAHSRHALMDGGSPVLGVCSVPALNARRAERRVAYTRMVDFAAVAAGVLLPLRACALFSQPEQLARKQKEDLREWVYEIAAAGLHDGGVRFAIGLILTHHWFFCHAPVAYELLSRVLGQNDSNIAYRNHGWYEPLRSAPADVASMTVPMLGKRLVSDVHVLVTHLARWCGLEPDISLQHVERHVNAGLTLLCGEAVRARDKWRLHAGSLAAKHIWSIHLVPTTGHKERATMKSLSDLRSLCGPGLPRGEGARPVNRHRDAAPEVFMDEESSGRAVVRSDQYPFCVGYTLRRIDLRRPSTTG